MPNLTPESTVFIVDDDQAVRESIALLLEAENLKVATYDSAEAFLTAYRTEWPGCLVLDISMPGMTGLDLQDALRANQIDIPIIFVTGHGDVPMSVKALKAGAFDFMEKPFNDELLISRVNDAIAWDRAHRERQARTVAAAVNAYAESIVQTVRMPLLVLDEQLHILSANRSFYENFKIPAPKKELPVLAEFASHLWSIPELKRRMDTLIHRGTELNDFEISHDFPQAGHKYLKVNARDLTQPVGQPRRIFLVLEDITQQKLAEEELRQHRNHLEDLVSKRTADLEASNRELESYSYSIAHDLRSPLRSIISFSQIVQENTKNLITEEDQDNLQRVVAAGKRMAKLIDDILELSRITRTELRYGSVNLSNLAEKSLIQLRIAQPEKSVNWTVQGDLIVHGDARLLEVLLQNLIENAWKYTRGRTPAQLEIGRTMIDGSTVYFVKDNGIGFNMEYLDKLFRPFHRLHSPQDFEGTGVGLATVQRVIQRHGGRVWAESVINQGTIFYFSLQANYSEQ